MIVNQQTGVVLGIAVVPVVGARPRVEVAHHQPILTGGVRGIVDGLRADVLDLEFAVLVALLVGGARRLIGRADSESIGLRPRVERHDVYRPALHGNPLNGGAVGHGLARLVRIGYFQQRLDRIFRRDGLRIVVAPAADGRVGVAVTGRQCRPAVGQEPGGGGLRRIRIVLVDGGRFAPYADVGIVFLHPRDEVVVIVRLVGPHAVLDVPVEHAQVVGAAAHLAERADLDIVHVEAVHAAAHVVAGPVEHRAVGRVVYDDLHVVPLLDGRFARRERYVALFDDVSPRGARVARIVGRQGDALAVDGGRRDHAAVHHLEQQEVRRSVLVAEIERNLHGTYAVDGFQGCGLENAPPRVTCAASQIALVFLAAEHIGIVGDIAARDVRIGHQVGRADRFAADLVPRVRLDERRAGVVVGDLLEGVRIAVASGSRTGGDGFGRRSVSRRLLAAHDVAAPDEIVETLVKHQVGVGGVFQRYGRGLPRRQLRSRQRVLHGAVLRIGNGDFQARRIVARGQHHVEMFRRAALQRDAFAVVGAVQHGETDTAGDREVAA